MRTRHQPQGISPNATQLLATGKLKIVALTYSISIIKVKHMPLSGVPQLHSNRSVVGDPAPLPSVVVHFIIAAVVSPNSRQLAHAVLGQMQ